MIELEESSAGVILRVRAQPGARKNEIRGVHDGALRIAITAAPEKGKANQAIVAVLSTAFDLPKSDIELVSGSTSRAKRFLLSGAEAAAIEAAINCLTQA